MTAIGAHVESGEFIESPHATYDLIICHDNRIVFRGHYETREKRLDQCIGVLTSSDLLAGTITPERASMIHELHHAHASTNPDTIINNIAELCRRWDIQVYECTTSRRSYQHVTSRRAELPQVLYSVITVYGPGQMIAEHFPNRHSRTASLVDRAEHFFASPGQIPDLVLCDEQRLAALVATFLMPATIALTESVLDEAHGVYRPTGIASPLGLVPSPNNRAG
ncbi:hypothetical protein [Kribbella catacumbae]|uniref:hypothetical protein n=1 Tax=Kribbella catacumbae TaxID=460086 RepID=UPI00037162A1|nr:hypothetical protein [Kribbella catacumbae]